MMDDNIKSFLQYVLEVAGRMERRVADEQLVCQKCHTSWHSFRTSGKMGCAACYTIFRENMAAALQSIHGTNKFAGKIPKGQAHKYTELLIKRELEENQRLLSRALDAEEYGLAASYRDIIGQLTQKLQPEEEIENGEQEGDGQDEMV